MKRWIPLAAALAFAAAAHAELSAPSHAHPTPLQNGAQSPYVDGEVKRIDREAGNITLKHGPIANLDMPAMSMVFRAVDRALLDRFKPGDKVRFKADNVQGALTVTEIRGAN